jgi:hypothetical protein
MLYQQHLHGEHDDMHDGHLWRFDLHCLRWRWPGVLSRQSLLGRGLLRGLG